MAEEAIQSDRISGYHAHVYYDTVSKDDAVRLRDAIAERFDTQLGRWHDAPIGPHPSGSYQVAFGPELFGTLVPWLALNRNGLTILVHPLTGSDFADHRDHPLWLGESQQLDLTIFDAEKS